MDNGLKSVKMSTAIFIVLTIAVLGFFIAGIGKSTTNQATEGLTISKAEAEGVVCAREYTAPYLENEAG